MRRLFLCCALSLILYTASFAFVLDRPLSAGMLRLEIEEKTKRLARMPSPKIVILAGSNGPYSHACAVIGPMMQLPCENAGIAVGIGLDDLFARYAPFLRRGDIVYMPMELQQYTTTRAQVRAGVDGFILLRYDRAVLRTLPADRIIASAFCCNLGDFLGALGESPVALSGAVNAESILKSQYNAQGDRIDNGLSRADPALLHHPARLAPAAGAVDQGFGSRLIQAFATAERARGVLVIGGLPTDFSTMRLPQPTLASVADIYLSAKGKFLVLPNKSLYPPADFFNGEDHLAQPCQYLHSILVADGIAGLLHRPVAPAPDGVLRLAETCPSAAPRFYAINAER